jgi:hypothetical protein
MNARQTYLAWVRTTQPKLYWSALMRTFGNNSNLGGLGDDLTSSVTPDLSVVDTTGALDLSPSSDVTDAVNSAYNATLTPSSSGSGDVFSSLANAITSIAPTIVQTQAAENLLQINTQRAAQGLAPLSANGVPVTGSMLSPTSASIAQMEAALSGSGSWLPLALIGGLALVGVAMMSGRR